MMKKKLLSLFLALTLVLGLVPAAVFAEGAGAAEIQDPQNGGPAAPAPESKAVAKIGEKSYTDLQEAINEVTAEESIILQSDITLNQNEGYIVGKGKCVRLDLNGHTIIQNVQTPAESWTFKNQGYLQLNDSKGNGAVKANVGDKGSAGDYENSVIINENSISVCGKIECSYIDENYTAFAIDNKPKSSAFLKKGGHIISSGTAVHMSAMNSANEGIDQFIIHGGSITAPRCFLIQCLKGTVEPILYLEIMDGEFKHPAGKTNIDSAITVEAENINLQFISINISGGTFDSDIRLTQKLQSAEEEPVPVSHEGISIRGGSFKGNFVVGEANDGDGNVVPIKPFIFGGNFVYSPYEYVAAERGVVPGDGIYRFKVTDKPEAPAVPASKPAEPEIKVKATELEGEDADLAQEAANIMVSVKAPEVGGSGLKNAVAEQAAKNTYKATDEDAAALNTTKENIKIAVQSFVKIEILDADKENNTITLNVSPMVHTVATTKDIAADDIVIGKNAVVVGDPIALNIEEPVTVKIKLPRSFTGNNTWVKHWKNDRIYFYNGTINDHVLSFTSPHGLSTIQIGAAPAAQINEVYYASLQDAVNDVKNGETITLKRAGLTAVCNRAVSFKVTGATCTISAGSRVVRAGDTESTTDYVFENKPSSGGNSGGGTIIVPDPEPEEKPEEKPAVASGWEHGAKGWRFVENGKFVTNRWAKDGHGWCYIGTDGYQAFDCWAMDSVDWCYVGPDGYLVTDRWVKDSVTWCYLGTDGRILRNAWIMDSIDWCYVGADGRMLTNAWQKDSVGLCYVGEDGRILRDQTVGEDKVDSEGHKI